MMNKKVLTIAGSDSGGGAGIQADLKTMCAYDVYGMSVITAVTAQNTLGVQQVEELPPGIVAAQLASVLEDIRPDAVKIGMIYSRENVEAVSEAIDRWKLKNIVLDPVMVSTSGRELLRPEAAEAMQELLFPRVTLVTPNVPETEKLLDFPSRIREWTDVSVDTGETADALAQKRGQEASFACTGKQPEPLAQMERKAADIWRNREEKGQKACQGKDAEEEQPRIFSRKSWVEASARKFSARWHTAFLIKGGHLEGAPADYLYDGGEGTWFPGQRIETRHTHGTGCTLSTAIACNLAKGLSMPEAVREAKEYLTGCIQHHPGIGNGAGPLNHLWRMGKAAI